MKQEPGGETAVGISSSTEPLTADKLMEYLGASIMATIIQVHHNDLYNSMAPAWKKIDNAGAPVTISPVWMFRADIGTVRFIQPIATKQLSNGRDAALCFQECHLGSFTPVMYFVSLYR